MNLQYVSFCPRKEGDTQLNNQCYRLFSSLWSQTFQELDGVSEFYSDAYVYADHVGALLFREEPIAIHIINWHDLYELNFQLRSLSHYPQAIREELKKNKVQKLCTMEYLCVHPNYRKHELVNFAMLMGYLSISTVRETEFNVMMTVTHNLRKVNRVCETLGMKKYLEIDHSLHNVPVDFYSLKQQDPFHCDDERVTSLGNQLLKEWKSKNYIEYLPIKRVA